MVIALEPRGLGESTKLIKTGMKILPFPPHYVNDNSGYQPTIPTPPPPHPRGEPVRLWRIIPLFFVIPAEAGRRCAWACALWRESIPPKHSPTTPQLTPDPLPIPMPREESTTPTHPHPRRQSALTPRSHTPTHSSRLMVQSTNCPNCLPVNLICRAISPKSHLGIWPFAPWEIS